MFFLIFRRKLYFSAMENKTCSKIHYITCSYFQLQRKKKFFLIPRNICKKYRRSTNKTNLKIFMIVCSIVSEIWLHKLKITESLWVTARELLDLQSKMKYSYTHLIMLIVTLKFFFYFSGNLIKIPILSIRTASSIWKIIHKKYRIL